MDKEIVQPYMTEDSKQLLEQLEKDLEYVFSDKALLQQALTHRSYAAEHGPSVPDYEVLEFLGDAVLELVISKLLYDRFGSHFKEGELTRMRASLVNESTLSTLAKELHLGDYLRLGHGEEKSGGQQKPSILADAFEALIGAIYLDGGIDAAFNFVENVFGNLLDMVESGGLDKDYKSSLQEVTQAKFHAVPNYKIVDVVGPAHDRHFTVSLCLEGKELARGKGHSKKEAEQDAAKKALHTLRKT